jgi:hypothetical protein
MHKHLYSWEKKRRIYLRDLTFGGCRRFCSSAMYSFIVSVLADKYLNSPLLHDSCNPVSVNPFMWCETVTCEMGSSSQTAPQHIFSAGVVAIF